jgi:hypothetical protein
MRGRQSTRLAFASVMGIVAVLAGARVLNAQAPAQGIKVHGHWVIEVRNADGTLAGHREFENALVLDGQRALAFLLRGGEQVNFWWVSLYSSPTICHTSQGAAALCLLAEPNDPHPDDTNMFRTLNKSVSSNQFVLQGSFVAPLDGGVDQVQTSLFVGIPGGTQQFGFTLASVGPAVIVRATQTVSVTVTFSFS